LLAPLSDLGGDRFEKGDDFERALIWGTRVVFEKASRFRIFDHRPDAKAEWGVGKAEGRKDLMASGMRQLPGSGGRESDCPSDA
jgi:hypothetical protein